jgi:hypothetical protein
MRHGQRSKIPGTTKTLLRHIVSLMNMDIQALADFNAVHWHLIVVRSSSFDLRRRV